jgi:hypothetical protein
MVPAIGAVGILGVCEYGEEGERPRAKGSGGGESRESRAGAVVARRVLAAGAGNTISTEWVFLWEKGSCANKYQIWQLQWSRIECF